jgi:16S rRNA (cytosine967-C5)-methyltransferase
VRRTFERGAYTDRALEAEARRHGLDSRDAALATRLAYGTVQRRATLDHLIERFAGRPADSLDAATRAALRLGMFELCFLDRAAPHAAVGEAVELSKAGGRGGHRLVNAVLRRTAREGRSELQALPDDRPEGAAIRHSHPEWVARLWWEALGPADAVALMAAGNEPAETALRANLLLATAEEVRARLEAQHVRARPAPRLPEGLVLDGRFDLRGSALFGEGLVMAQSRASMLVSRVLDPQPGERVLDLCAAPGAKATHLAALMGNRGEVVAVELRPARARALAANCRRMAATCVSVRTADAREDHGRDFDRVLVDAPCSGLGTLRSRPDLRWRARPDALPALERLQAQILVAAARALRPGGVLVYSTCTVSPAENERQVAALLASHPELVAEDLHSDYPLWKHPAVADHLLLLPHRDGTDGFFIARLRKAGDRR